MDLRVLRSFVVVADYAGFSRAAEHLGISQPALSRQISALESELDVRLFDRIGRQTVLTPAGQDLLGRGRSLLRDAELIRSRAKEIADGSCGMLRLGATPQSIESFVWRMEPQISLRPHDMASFTSQLPHPRPRPNWKGGVSFQSMCSPSSREPTRSTARSPST
jgi:DNA-binding transcriptional LysR family regulator